MMGLDSNIPTEPRKECPDHIRADYERMSDYKLHYENLIYASTSPVFTLCLALAGLAITVDAFSFELRILASAGGIVVSIITLAQVATLRKLIIGISEMMQAIELEYEIGFSKRLYGVARTGVWRFLPTNMRMRMIVFGFFLCFFGYILLALLIGLPLA